MRMFPILIICDIDELHDDNDHVELVDQVGHVDINDVGTSGVVIQPKQSYRYIFMCMYKYVYYGSINGKRPLGLPLEDFLRRGRLTPDWSARVNKLQLSTTAVRTLNPFQLHRFSKHIKRI